MANCQKSLTAVFSVALCDHLNYLEFRVESGAIERHVFVMSKIPATIWLVLRLLFGALFIWSGVAKVKDPISFAEAVRNFELIGDPFAAAAALFIPWVEILAGLAVMAGVLHRGGLAILLASLVVFTLALGISWARGLDVSCGCFGGSGPVNYPLRIISNCGLIALGWAILHWEPVTTERKVAGAK